MRDRLIAGLLERKRGDLLSEFDFHASRVRDFDPSRKSILLLHDLPGDPESEHLKEDKGARFTQMVFVSHWQFQQYQSYYGLSGENCSVIRNAIELFDESERLLIRKGWMRVGRVTAPWVGSKDHPHKDEFHIAGNDPDTPIRLIYHTTPHRGLEILLPVYEALYDEYKARGVYLHLDIFSSFGVYGWDQRDAPYEGLFEMARNHEGISYHGAKSNLEVREALKQSHIFAFPSIWPETSCLAMIEAMASGTHVVHSNLAALPETSAGLGTCYPFVTDRDEHASLLYDNLDKAIESYWKHEYNTTALAQQVVERNYNVNSYVKQWITLLDSLKTSVD